MVAAMKYSPPSVASPPPRFGVPQSMCQGSGTGPISWIEPSGACHATLPSSRSMATSLPQGGAVQGMPRGDSSGPTANVYGVPCMVTYMVRWPATGWSCRLGSPAAPGISCATNGAAFTLTTRRRACGE